MAQEPSDLKAAIAEALEVSEFPTEERANAAEWDAFDAEEPAAAPAAEPSKDETEGDPVETPAETSEEAQPVELPWYLQGLDLDGIPEDKLGEITKVVEQQQGYIQQLQARLAEKPEEPAAPEAPAEPEEVDDETLLRAAGYDPEDFEVQQMAKFILPSLRRELALEDQVSAMAQERQVEQTQTAWNQGLDQLETEYGKLPVTRVDALRLAVEDSIASPFELYWRIKAPLEKQVGSVVESARREALKREQGGQVKPRATGGTTPNVDMSKLSLREATKVAMKEAEQETGVKWSSIFKRPSK